MWLFLKEQIIEALSEGAIYQPEVTLLLPESARGLLY